VDQRVIALAHTLEVRAHGGGRLRAAPAPARVAARGARSKGQRLPGWGSVPNPEDWEEIDEINAREEAEAAALLAKGGVTATTEAAAGSRSGPQSRVGVLSAPLTPATARDAPAPSTPADDGEQQQQKDQEDEKEEEEEEEDDASDSGDSGQAEDDDGEGWTTAARSRTAQRRRARRAARREAHRLAFEAEWADHADAVARDRQAGDGEGDDDDDGEQDQQQQPEPVTLTAEEAAEGVAWTSRGRADDGEEDEEQDEDEDEVEEGSEDDGEAAAGGPSSSAAAANHNHNHDDNENDDDDESDRSSVAVVTADYAMQNVLLQMGLRLVTRDGQVIRRLSRWALRCGACFAVTREPGRIFCPKCGNMPLDKVEVVVGADGTEVFGGRRRHVLRGTRYSLPKPRGGRAGTAANPILREDVFLQKVKALGGSKQGPRRSAAAVDAFAPEYGADTWHEGGGGGGGGGVPANQRSQRELAQHRGAAGLVVPSWRRNPNEPKMRRSNRRK
jgi:RNA-binding protein NOB1